MEAAVFTTDRRHNVEVDKGELVAFVFKADLVQTAIAVG